MQAIISKTRALFISLPNFGQDLLRGPSGTIIQGIYAVNFGLDLATIGTILLLTKIFDAFTDPVVGMFSDRYYHAYGTRKPWLVIGTLLSILGMWLLFTPSVGVSAAYFLFSYLLMYLGWTLAEIPYAAWKAEVNHHYDSRTRVAAMDSFFGFLGTLSFSLIPITMVGLGMSEKVEYSIESVHFTAWVVTLILPVMVGLALWKVPDGVPLQQERRTSLKENLSAVLQAKPVFYFMVIYFLSGLAMGMTGAVNYLYLVRYAHASELVVYSSTWGLFVVIVAIPLGAWLCRVVGKHRVWAFSLVVVVLGVVIKDFLVDHSLPDAAHFKVNNLLMLFIMGIPAIMVSFYTVAVSGLQGDLTDYGQWKFRSNFSGSYLSFMLLMNKIAAAFGAFLALNALQLSGFDAKSGVEITLSGAWCLRLTFTWIPALLLILTIPLVFYYPLTREKHLVLLKALERRSRREAATVVIDDARHTSLPAAAPIVREPEYSSRL
ncbi:MFS transporter [Shewanella sp. AS1]|uniref:MFS transporter n=1 Tax=Shewanella sp. AS1 TaxID=2907626 RepID=UPI001F2543D0|nr:MFS transporter [Shewanella sp. AS1]MCE9680594.1 MFS transporter [Shewanella sp. AS1]